MKFITTIRAGRMPQLPAESLAGAANFCWGCARAWKRGPAHVASPAATDAFWKYTDTPQSTSKAEHKQITVLFADMKSSMELIADRDPEEAHNFLDPVLERMMEAVQRYEGTTSNLRGDGIMALFGAPLAHEDHGIRACYAALRMQEAVKRYAQEIQRTHGVPIQIRVGLNSGEALVCLIGNDVRRGYTAVGHTVHLAARMEQAAMPGSILITGSTLRLAEGYVQAKALGQLHVKGLSAAVEVMRGGHRRASGRYALGRKRGRREA